MEQVAAQLNGSVGSGAPPPGAPEPVPGYRPPASWDRAGVHPKVVQERLGHASIQITLDTYSHVMPGMQEDAAAKVGALVFG